MSASSPSRSNTADVIQVPNLTRPCRSSIAQFCTMCFTSSSPCTIILSNSRCIRLSYLVVGIGSWCANVGSGSTRCALSFGDTVHTFIYLYIHPEREKDRGRQRDRPTRTHTQPHAQRDRPTHTQPHAQIHPHTQPHALENPPT